MTLLSRFFRLLLLLHGATIIPATSSIPFYNDRDCDLPSFLVDTDTQAESGTCQVIHGSSIHSVNPSMVDDGCTGMLKEARGINRR